LIGAFGLANPVRSGVKKSVHFTRYEAEMGVRIISGDHMETAKAVAQNVGIISEEERDGAFTVMHADDFESKIGGFDRNGGISNL